MFFASQPGYKLDRKGSKGRKPAMNSTRDNRQTSQTAGQIDREAAGAETETGRRSRRRRVLALLVGDAACAARRYVTNFRAGRGAE